MYGWLRRYGRQRIHFLHVGKTGGTAVKHVLRDFLSTPRYALKLHGHETSLADIRRGQSVIFFLHSPHYGRALEAMRVIGHFAPYRKWYIDVEYFLSRLQDILFIGFQESLESDFDKLKMLLDIPRHVGLPTDGVAAHRMPTGLNTMIDDEGLTALRDWYAEDMEFTMLCRELMSVRSGLR